MVPGDLQAWMSLLAALSALLVHLYLLLRAYCESFPSSKVFGALLVAGALLSSWFIYGYAALLSGHVIDIGPRLFRPVNPVLFGVMSLWPVYVFWLMRARPQTNRVEIRLVELGNVLDVVRNESRSNESD